MNELWISTHGGKLAGFRSVSSACSFNRHCKSRAKNPETICFHCYAERYAAMRKGLEMHLIENFKWLQTLHPLEDFPKTTGERYFRLESFGDVASVNHARNFIRFAKANPKTTFAVWTKNLGYYRTAVGIEGKPSNLVVIYSSPFVGKVLKPKDGFVDHVFTVMPKDTPDERINCGARSCLGCLKCYSRRAPFYIYERLK